MKSDADNVDNMHPFYICTYTSWFAIANHTYRIDFTFFLTAFKLFSAHCFNSVFQYYVSCKFYFDVMWQTMLEIEL